MLEKFRDFCVWINIIILFTFIFSSIIVKETKGVEKVFVKEQIKANDNYQLLVNQYSKKEPIIVNVDSKQWENAQIGQYQIINYNKKELYFNEIYQHKDILLYSSLILMFFILTIPFALKKKNI